jgi:uncharacterized protein with PQ loop repeat
MALTDITLLAGTVSTSIFVASYLPMLVKAIRSKDLSSYSPVSLVLANAGNAVHAVYVFSLPAGPLWALHGFYLIGSAVMLIWWLRYGRPRSGSRGIHPSPGLRDGGTRDPPTPSDEVSESMPNVPFH